MTEPSNICVAASIKPRSALNPGYITDPDLGRSGVVEGLSVTTLRVRAIYRRRVLSDRAKVCFKDYRKDSGTLLPLKDMITSF